MYNQNESLVLDLNEHSTTPVSNIILSIALDKVFFFVLFFFQPKIICMFLISQRKHMLWVLIRITSVRRF